MRQRKESVCEYALYFQGIRFGTYVLVPTVFGGAFPTPWLDTCEDVASWC